MLPFLEEFYEFHVMALVRTKSVTPVNCRGTVDLDLFQSYAISHNEPLVKPPRSSHVFELHILHVETTHPSNEFQKRSYLEGTNLLFMYAINSCITLVVTDSVSST